MSQELPVLTMMVALHCEAKPWIDGRRLKKIASCPFDHYQAAGVDLVISGVGSLPMATAVGWIGAQGGDRRVWLNVGTAGHATRAVGELVRVHGCAASFEGRAHYPPMTAKWLGETDAVLSVAIPGNDYPGGAMVDMEAVAFFEAATRFSSAELVQSLKVISDNQEQGIDELNASRITSLMQLHVQRVNEFADHLQGLALPPAQSGLAGRFADRRGTHSQHRQLNELLHKLHVLGLSHEVAALPIDKTTPAATLITALTELLESAVPVIEADLHG